MLFVGFVPSPAHARAPTAEAVARSVTDARAAARAQAAAEFDVRIRALPMESDAARAPADPRVLHGALRVDARGRARLQFTREDGSVEVQERAFGVLRAERDGASVRQPFPLLPPLWLLQARTPERLLDGLTQLGGDAQRVELAYDGDHDCYVIGGREGAPAFWIDKHEPHWVGIQLGPGRYTGPYALRPALPVRYRFGPEVPHGDTPAHWPAWYTVETPGTPALQVELQAPAQETIQTNP